MGNVQVEVYVALRTTYLLEYNRVYAVNLVNATEDLFIAQSPTLTTPEGKRYQTDMLQCIWKYPR